MLNEQTLMNAAVDLPAPTVTPLVQLLERYAQMLARLSDEHYVTKPVGPVDGSIGGHTRHCLDHARALLEAAQSGLLNYDNRERDTQLEASRALALRHIRELIEQLNDLPQHAMDQDLTLTTLLSADGQPVAVRSSIGRELAYVLSHTVHHHALISAMVKTLGGWLPNHFGYAPSTIAFHKSRSCAR
jgi:uncharacterized damage-inducible protein DinB